LLVLRLYARPGTPSRRPSGCCAGGSAHKNQQVFEALLVAYGKARSREVLRHVQVERYFISRRYRVGAVTLGPELSVDAGERQVTADRSSLALPASLQAGDAVRGHGELVEAAGGVLEFSDLLKRPSTPFATCSSRWRRARS
jgi:serine protein kinase